MRVLLVFVIVVAGCVPLPARHYEYAVAPVTLQGETLGEAKLIASNNDPQAEGSPFTLALALRADAMPVDSVRVVDLQLRTETDSVAVVIEVLRLEPDKTHANRWITAVPRIPIRYGTYRLTGVRTLWQGSTPHSDTLAATLTATPMRGWIFWPWSYFSG